MRGCASRTPAFNSRGLVEPLAVVPAEDLRGVGVADGLWRRVPGFILGPTGDVILEFLVADLSDRIAVLGLMRFAAGNLAVCGIGRCLVASLLDEFQLR